MKEAAKSARKPNQILSVQWDGASPRREKIRTTCQISKLRCDACINHVAFTVFVCAKENYRSRERSKHSWYPSTIKSSSYALLSQDGRVRRRHGCVLGRNTCIALLTGLDRVQRVHQEVPSSASNSAGNHRLLEWARRHDIEAQWSHMKYRGPPLLLDLFLCHGIRSRFAPPYVDIWEGQLSCWQAIICQTELALLSFRRGGWLGQQFSNPRGQGHGPSSALEDGVFRAIRGNGRWIAKTDNDEVLGCCIMYQRYSRNNFWVGVILLTSRKCKGWIQQLPLLATCSLYVIKNIILFYLFNSKTEFSTISTSITTFYL